MPGIRSTQKSKTQSLLSLSGGEDMNNSMPCEGCHHVPTRVLGISDDGAMHLAAGLQEQERLQRRADV